MAKFTRAEIRRIIGENCTDEMETALIALHHGIIDAVRDELDAVKADAEKYRTEAEKLPGIQKQLDDLRGGEDFAAKYAKEHEAFEAYKAQIARDAKAGQIREAYRKLLLDEKIGQAWADRIVKLEDFSGMDIDADGTLKDADALRERVRKNYGEYITTETTKGAVVETPPQSGKPRMTRDEILAIKDTAQRQAAIAENHDLFGF